MTKLSEKQSKRGTGGMTMREILFRGKIIELCEYQGQWLEGFYAVENGKPFIAIPKENGLNGFYCDPETVGQFTGLTDKNGKKIFDGDILSTSKWKGVVTWGDGYGGYCVQHGINRPAIDIVMNEFDVDVIGNIYDNPELMGGNK